MTTQPDNPATRAPKQYGAFLKSEYWKKVRRVVLERDRHRCQECGSGDRLQVHHLSYRHHGKEFRYQGDLVTVCGDCHKVAHFEQEIYGYWIVRKDTKKIGGGKRRTRTLARCITHETAVKISREHARSKIKEAPKVYFLVRKSKPKRRVRPTIMNPIEFTGEPDTEKAFDIDSAFAPMGARLKTTPK